MDGEFLLQRAVMDDGKPAIFVLHTADRISQAVAAQIGALWKAAWEDAGVADCPCLMVLQGNMTIQALTNAQLLEAGLMRINRATQ